MTLVGPVVLDIVQHFTERWNEIKKRKVCPVIRDVPSYFADFISAGSTATNRNLFFDW